jgi:hypothetical protein
MPLLHALAALALALSAAPALAGTESQVVYDTFDLNDGDTDAIIGQFQANDLQLAYPFVPQKGVRALLETVTLRLRHSPDPVVMKGDFIVRLREDDGGEPGPVLEEWTFTDVLNAETNVEFVSVAQPVIEGEQTYWLNVLIAPATGQGLWISAQPRTRDLLFANTGGLDPVWQEPPNPFLIGFASVVVPEPAQLCLALVGALVLAPFGRRRTRA